MDYAGLADPFDVKVAAAHMRIVMSDVDAFGALGRSRSVVLRGVEKTLIARRLPEGYALVVVLRRRAGFTRSSRAFDTCERELIAEAGWAIRAPHRWFPVPVALDHRGRPNRVGLPSVCVEVLGALNGLSKGERGFRIRSAAGSELTLVRESGAHWYAEEDPSGLLGSLHQ